MNRAQRSEELSFAEDDSGYLKQRVGNCKLENPEVGACLVLSRKSKGGQYGSAESSIGKAVGEHII